MRRMHEITLYSRAFGVKTGPASEVVGVHSIVGPDGVEADRVSRNFENVVASESLFCNEYRRTLPITRALIPVSRRFLRVLNQSNDNSKWRNRGALSVS